MESGRAGLRARPSAFVRIDIPPLVQGTDRTVDLMVRHSMGIARPDIDDPRRGGERGEYGFTLVELLVVMLIVALLAAIAIPTFFRQGDKARDASAKAAARTAETAAEIVATDNDGKYNGPNGVTVASLREQEQTLNAADLTVSGVTADQYRVTIASLTGNTFTVKRNGDGTVEFTCTFASTGGCPASGHWAG
jgi:prepilin-type N-terminal cleavage/methylation domain-containing protein